MHCNMNGFYNSVKEWLDAGMPLNSFVRGDCMDGIAAMPEKFTNLAIVDPQYGINETSRGIGRDFSVPASFDKRNGKQLTAKPNYEKKIKHWDKERPNILYFVELRRASENQIIFGGNYFSDMLPISMGWIIWEKMTTGNLSDCELLWTSFWRANRLVKYMWNGLQQGAFIGSDFQIGNKKINEIRIHPTQKPIRIYRWLLQNYATPGDIILDTHVGSASSLIACEQMGFQYIGFEIDSDYFHDACNRILQARKLLQQNEIFQREEVYNDKQIQHELF